MKEVQDKFLRWKGFWYLLTRDREQTLLKHFFHHPLVYGWRALRSYVLRRPYIKDENRYLYNVSSFQDITSLLARKDSYLILGISYCQKPLDCPCGRFNTNCIHEDKNEICKNCFIKGAYDKFPKDRGEFIVLTTVHYIANKILNIMYSNPNKKCVFAMCACPLSLEMFSDWGNVIAMPGIGLSLCGPVCSSMRAFKLAEVGVKPLKTELKSSSEIALDQILEILK